jgi:hypothetical protein
LENGVIREHTRDPTLHIGTPPKFLWGHVDHAASRNCSGGGD